MIKAEIIINNDYSYHYRVHEEKDEKQAKNTDEKFKSYLVKDDIVRLVASLIAVANGAK